MTRKIKFVNKIFSKVYLSHEYFKNFSSFLPIRSKKRGRFEKLLGFVRSHSSVTRAQ